jgi:acetyl-CoA carboxylase carboxyl transferase subunit beta
LTVTSENAVTIDTAWVVCSGCQSMLYGKRLARNLKVCPECGYHHMLTARERVSQLFDPGAAVILEFGVSTKDVLSFVDTKHQHHNAVPAPGARRRAVPGQSP